MILSSRVFVQAVSEAVGEEGEEEEKEEGAPPRPQRAVDVSKDPGKLNCIESLRGHSPFLSLLPFGHV